MRGEHDVCSLVVREIKVILQDMNNEVHWRDRVVMDGNAIKRLKLRFGLFDDLNIGDGLKFHTINCKRITMRLKVDPFPCR